MYYEYWGLNKPPFDNVPDPSMYVESHASVENTIAETLFAIEEGNECVAVIVGDVGLGKTLSLRLILDNLSQDKYKVAFITNPDMSFVQLLREIVGQLTGEPCEMQKRLDLLETFNKILFETADEGKKVLVFIDEANALPPGNLESLRLLTNMQDDHKNLFTIVLAGQIEFAKRLENPRRANIFQRIGTYCKIDKIQSPDLVKDYVETRLRLAGGSKGVFTDEAIHVLWEYSDHGVPRLINKIAKLCLKAGETNNFEVIDGATARQIAERFQKLTGPALQKRRPRKRNGVNVAATSVESEAPEQEEFRSLKLLDDGVAEEEYGQPDPEVETSEQVEQEAVAPEPLPAEVCEEAIIGKYKIKIGLPLHLIQQSASTTRDDRVKLAGSLAAQTLEKYPQLTVESVHDPVALWSEIKNLILSALERHMEVDASAQTVTDGEPQAAENA
jgi:type II secretory pathway predicted ATPase ExeA